MLRRLSVRAAALLVAAMGAVAPLRAQVPLETYADAFTLRSARGAPRADYTLTVRPDDRSAYYVEMHVVNAPDSLRVVIPAWAPGAYRLMNSGANIADVTAATSDGRRLAVTRDGAIAWRVATGGARDVVVRYSAALRNTPRWAAPNNRWFLRATSGLVDGPRTFMYVDGAKLAPARVTFRLPAGWRIATGLRPTADSTSFVAASYDVLIDSPALLGRFVDYRFDAAGVPHRAVVDLGDAQPGYDEAKFVATLRRIAETEIALFGGAPYPDYTFIYAGVGGGLEHLNSTTIGFNAADMAADPAALKSVTAHEFFHLWNVKRLRPAELGPFDYTAPVRTLNLWWSEGVTDYYANVLLARAGLMTPSEFATELAGSIAAHRGNPGRLVVSPERASWTVWDPPTVNDGQSISYYLQGSLLGLMLDLTIRDSTDGRRSLDDVMRYMFDHYAGARGFTGEDLLNGILHATGVDAHGFWQRYVSGTAEIPWNDILRLGGWQATFREVPVDRPDVRMSTLTPAIEGGGLRGLAVPGSAAQRAGLRTGDEWVRVNGQPIASGADLRAALAGVQLNAPVTLDVRRDGRPVTIRFTAAPYTRLDVTVGDLPQMTEKMRRIRQGLLTGR